MSRLGINIGDTEILLYTRLFLGNKYVFDAQGKVTVAKQWNDYPTVYAYQTVVRNISAYSKKLPVFETMHDIFIPGTFCFMLGHPYYGAMGEVQSYWISYVTLVGINYSN
jgi:5'-3' exoribonuclease 1